MFFLFLVSVAQKRRFFKNYYAAVFHDAILHKNSTSKIAQKALCSLYEMLYSQSSDAVQ